MKKKNYIGEDQSQAKSEKVFGEDTEKDDIGHLVEWRRAEEMQEHHKLKNNPWR